MAFKKTTITIPNSLHGDREQEVYAKDGIGVGRVGKAWGVFHIAGQAEVYHKLQRRTKAEAIDVAEQILALDVDWTKGKDCRALSENGFTFEEQFRAAVGEIRRIAG